MYRAEVVYDLQPLLNQRKKLEQEPNGSLTVVKRAIEREVLPPLLDELRYVPPQDPESPFIWSHDPQANRRAQIKYIIMVRRGEVQTANGHYVRDGKLQAGYTVGVLISDQAAALFVSNPYKGRKWVVGKFQIPSHAKIYPKEAETFAFWSDAAKEVAVKAVAKRYKGN